VLVEQLDWRTTYLVLAAILAAVTIPTHWWGLRGPWPHPAGNDGTDSDDHRAVVRSPAFATLVVALSLAAFAAFAGVFNLVPLLIERGFSPSLAAVTLGLGGAGQVLGRLGYLPLAARTSARSRLVGVIVVIAATTAVLGISSAAAALIAISIDAGLARGIFTLVQATAISERWGTTHYGRLNGLVSAPIVIVMALAPWAGTALSGATGSYAHTYLILAGIALLGSVVAAASVPRKPSAERAMAAATVE
jgi:cyanate permease